MSSVFTSAAAKDAARLMAVVVLPTPPFWLATAITRPIDCRGARAVRRIVRFAFRKQGRTVVHKKNLCAKRVPMFRAEHFERAINVPRGTLREKVRAP